MNLHSRPHGPSNQPMSNVADQEPQDHSRDQVALPVVREADQGEKWNISFSKGPKRKRLAKACGPCHKSKRRCDGTAPCSNCYFASKTCTYTDASGRPVPAPRNMPPESAQPAPGTPETLVPSDPPAPQTGQASSSRVTLDHGDDDRTTLRKRYRSDRGLSVAPPESIARNPCPLPSGNAVFDGASVLDPTLTLFFTHRHPQRLIIHKPSFSAALSHNCVPAYLLHSMCALAAPLSKQPRIRTNPARLAGQPFAHEAASLMFNNAGRLVCEPDLATAQALCLLQMHETIVDPSRTSRYHDMALQVLENLGAHKPDIPVITPVPSPEFIHMAIERECVRRMFWLIHLVDLLSSIFLKTSLLPNENELMLRLPADETSFELAVHSTLPEYLYMPAPRTQYASEVGHLIRIVSIYANIESKMDGKELDTWVPESEQALDSWISSLPDHLCFTEDSLQMQMSMFETSSNTGAWCFCYMHVVHASCMLALTTAKQRGECNPTILPNWPVVRLDLIMASLGGRAKNSPILGSVLWPLIKYCHRDDPQVHEWSADHEERWGIRIEDCVSIERGQPTPASSMQIQGPPRPRQPEQQGDDPSRPLHEISSNQGQHTDPRGSASTRSVSDTDFDPALEGDLGTRNQIGGDVPPSLPSLKSSGLLDSWNTPTDRPSTSGQMSWNTSSHVHSNTPSMVECQQDLEVPSRPLPSGMPVGMAWLANEPTATR